MALTCRQLVEFLDLYRSGELPPRNRAEFEKHLSECEACRTYLQTYRDTVALAQEAEHQDAAEVAPAKLIDAILAALGVTKGGMGRGTGGGMGQRS